VQTSLFALDDIAWKWTDIRFRENIPEGRPIVIVGMPDTVYDALPEVRATSLKRLMAQSPLHARDAEEDEDEDPRASGARLIGSLAHTLLRNPEGAAEQYAACPFPRRQGKGYEAWLASLPDGVIVISEGQAAAARAAVAAVYADPEAGPLCSSAAGYEITVLWEERGIGFKAKADFLTWQPEPRPEAGEEAGWLIADLKTTRNAHPDAFSRQAWDLGYPLQMHHYRRGFAAAGLPIAGIRIIAVENRRPYAASVLYPDRLWNAYGEREWGLATATWATCLRDNRWPGYSGRLEPLVIPPYLARDLML
jgi:hypothetical protein